MDRPKVFEEGTVTLVVSPGGCSMYAGSNEIELFNEIELEVRNEGRPPKLKLRFQQSHDEEMSLRIDAEKRLFRALSWPDILR